MNKHTDVFNTEDIKDKNGYWRKSHRPIPFVQYHTRSGILWHGINYRCKDLGKYQDRQVTYKGCENLFETFHNFAEWCQTEYGYRLQNEGGKYWALDKDMLVPGSRVYSPETCIFIPQAVNNLFTLRQNKRGDFPIGVIWHKRDKIFEASCNDGKGKVIYLGRFGTALEGHLEWIKYKIHVMENIIVDPEFKNHNKLQTALELRINLYKDHYNSGTILSF